MISTFDLFKIGIGPSSSHTVGPMIAAGRFRRFIVEHLPRCAAVEAELYGSLAWTGKGHGTDRSICLGLAGEQPDTVDVDMIDATLAKLAEDHTIALTETRALRFDPSTDIRYEKRIRLPFHPNGLCLVARDRRGAILNSTVYYSVGGGFIVEEGAAPEAEVTPPHPFGSAAALLACCREHGLEIADVQRANDSALLPGVSVGARLDEIREAMFACIDRGMAREGNLPGRLNVARRAKGLHASLVLNAAANRLRPHETMDWVSVYAIAVNEENAAGARVVTAPTNGAAGILAAVLRYYRDFYPDYSDAGSHVFLLTAAAIGSVIKRNASISGAEVGCQGETGSAAAMAAAGLAAVSGGTPAQIENAAEIALEHHLGMTCDPIGGLVQIPCIERNAIGAHKAIAAASLALRGNGIHRVSLDEAIETMRQTGRDMKSKYKETSRGGLAVNVADC